MQKYQSPFVKTDHPNVLLIMTDQWRYDWVGYAGADWLKTPNIDRLASRSRVFNNCFTNSPTCSPARVSLACGQQPPRVGGLDNHVMLPLTKETFITRLRNHGFRTGCVGKMDYAKPDPYNGRNGDRPIAYAWGFTHPHEVEGKMHAGRGFPPNGPYTYYLEENGLLEQFTTDYKERKQTKRSGGIRANADSVLPTEHFADVYIGRKSREFIRNIPKDFPWFLFTSFVGPHNPFDPPTEYAERWRNADVPDAIPDASVDACWNPPNATYTKEEITWCRRQYAAYIELIDDQIGLMLETLEETGQADDTYVIFTSDHGEMLGDHQRYTKGVFFEPSLHVPLTIAGPDITPGTSDALIELMDLNPTMCELAGVPPVERIDAISIAPILHDKATDIHEEAISSHRNGYCVRTKTHKMNRAGQRGRELFDLINDPDELHNIASAHPELTSELDARYHHRMQGEAWLR